MKCHYHDEIEKFHESTLSIEKTTEIEAHLETCRECRDYLEVLNFSKNFISNEQTSNKNFYSLIENKIDDRYTQKNIHHSLISGFLKLKPVVKPILGSAAALLFVIILSFSLLYLKGQKNVTNNEYPSQISVKGQSIVDDSDNTIILKGVFLSNNVWGNWTNGISEKLQSEGKYPLVAPKTQDPWVLTDEDFKRIKDLGVNCVYYGFNYELFSSDNPQKKMNVKKLKDHISKFASENIYTIPSLVIAPGLNYVEIAGTSNKARQFEKTVFEDEKLYEQWLEMWIYLAKELKGIKGIGGYSVLAPPLIPSDTENSKIIFKERITLLCKEIRNIDKDHIIFIPECTGSTFDESGFIKISDPNTAYTFNFFEPIEFTYNSSGNFDAQKMELIIGNCKSWSDTNNAPLVSIFGTTRNNNIQLRLSWLETSLSLFKKNNISSVLNEYKTNIGPYIDCKKGFFALYGDFKDWQKELIKYNRNYDYISEDVRKSAIENSFDGLLQKYYVKDGEIHQVSSLDNDQFIQLLKEYFLN